MKPHILLVGMPGSGKTTLGKLLAEKLGASFVDIDALIMRRMQMPVSRIFAEHGESKFRELEAETVRQALAKEPSIISPGGGWIMQPGVLEEARPKCFMIYLKVMAQTVAKRAADGTRPLLVGDDPVERARQLIKEREPVYQLADCELKTDVKTPPTLVTEILSIVCSRAGW